MNASMWRGVKVGLVVPQSPLPEGTRVRIVMPSDGAGNVAGNAGGVRFVAAWQHGGPGGVRGIVAASHTGMGDSLDPGTGPKGAEPAVSIS